MDHFRADTGNIDEVLIPFTAQADQRHALVCMDVIINFH